MSDPLSDAFRANVLRIAEQRCLSLYRLGKIVTPNDPRQARYQLVGRPHHGFTLATVHRYAVALGVPATALIDDACKDRSRRGREANGTEARWQTTSIRDS